MNVVLWIFHLEQDFYYTTVTCWACHPSRAVEQRQVVQRFTRMMQIDPPRPSTVKATRIWIQ